MEQMKNFIDIHTHILPEVDDGARTMEESMQMLDLLYQQGVRTVVATPHFEPGSNHVSGEQLKRVFEDTRDALTKLHADMELFLGNEVFYIPGIAADMEEFSVFSMAHSRYVLIEFPENSPLDYLQKAILEFRYNGFYPIIAHVERYSAINRDIRNIERLIEAGAYIQVNLSSLSESFFNRRSTFCKKIIEQGCVHFLGTDCHRMDWRRPEVDNGVQILQKCVSLERIQQLLHVNPKKIIQNELLN